MSKTRVNSPTSTRLFSPISSPTNSVMNKSTAAGSKAKVFSARRKSKSAEREEIKRKMESFFRRYVAKTDNLQRGESSDSSVDMIKDFRSQFVKEYDYLLNKPIEKRNQLSYHRKQYQLSKINLKS